MLNKKSSHLVTLSVYYISQSHIEQYLQEFEENLMMLFIWCWTLPGTWFFPNVKLYLLVWVHKGQFSLTRRSTLKCFFNWITNWAPFHRFGADLFNTVSYKNILIQNAYVGNNCSCQKWLLCTISTHLLFFIVTNYLSWELNQELLMSKSSALPVATKLQYFGSDCAWYFAFWALIWDQIMTLFKVEPIEIPKYKTLCYVGDDLISFWAIFDDTQLHISRMNPIMLLIILNGFTP